MSVNQISQDHLWRQHHHHDSPNSSNSLLLFQNFNLNHPNDVVRDSQHPAALHHHNNNNINVQLMFEKPLTPSDVGKLNRLVIPKQHAERHFPLNTSSNGVDSGGMLLSFEDEDGKFWRFRYSYWNSSQSYVLTKGWSRYVKDKRLDAGDVVIFQRHVSDPDRLFISWRRRLHDPAHIDSTSTAATVAASLYHAHHHHRQQPATDLEASIAGVGKGSRTASFNGSTSSRTLRLFGVNMEYQFESDQSEPVTPDGSSTSSPNANQQQHHGVYQHYSHFYPQAYYAMVQQDGSSHSQHRG